MNALHTSSNAPKSVNGDKNETNRPQTDTDPIDDQKCFKRALNPWMVREPYMEWYRTTYREATTPRTELHDFTLL